jgi:hypothetical protein
MLENDSVTAPWSNMPHHRVAAANCHSIAKKILRLLHLCNAHSEHDLWGTASAKEQARAMLGGTTGSREEISSVLSRATRSRRRAQSGRNARWR